MEIVELGKRSTRFAGDQVCSHGLKPKPFDHNLMTTQFFLKLEPGYHAESRFESGSYFYCDYFLVSVQVQMYGVKRDLKFPGKLLVPDLNKAQVYMPLSELTRGFDPAALVSKAMAAYFVGHAKLDFFKQDEQVTIRLVMPFGTLTDSGFKVEFDFSLSEPFNNLVDFFDPE